MKNPFTLPASGDWLHAAQSLLFGLGAAYPLLAALRLPVDAALCAACCGAAAAAYLLLCCIKRAQWLFYPLLLIAMIAPFAPHRDQLLSIGNALTLLMSGQPLALAAYARPVGILVSLMTAAMGLSLARSEASFFPTVMLTIGVLFAVSFSGAQVAAAALLPLSAAVLLSARAQGVTFLRILPGVALIVLLTLLLLPMAGSTVPALSDYADRVRQAIDDYFFFNDARTAFSLSATGYQPLGSERLGGAIAPGDAPVMQVETSGRTLLRGVVKNEYTGLAWKDTTLQRRYLFVNPRFYQMKDELFDFSRPAAPWREMLPQSETITVTMRAEATSTLYLTQRFAAPKGEGIVAYFSPSGEVFATHSLQMGETYAFSGTRLTGETPGVRNAVLGSLDARDPHLETVRGTYLALPQSVGGNVYDLASQICARLDNDYDRAAAICMYLQNTYPYTLMQGQPPANRDFVTWFLFEEKQGYCTSFASAMAVLCRAAGIPARYVEGYAATPDADGIARVTQEHAHAWVEAYFPGFGWLSFDPTPGIGQSPDTSPYTPPQDEPQGGETPNPSGDPQGEDEPTPTPSPTPTAVPTPTPSPTVLPTPTPQHDDPNVTPTPEITPTPSPAPQITPSPTPQVTPPRDDADEPKDKDFLWLLLFLLVLALAAALAVWRLYMAAPAHAAARVRLTTDMLLIWYAAIEEALRALGVTAHPGEAPATFLRRAQETLGGKMDLMRLGRAVCTARYSRHRPSAKQVEHAQRVYAALLARQTYSQRLGMYARRLMLGTKLYR